jgi:hypothetical protein
MQYQWLYGTHTYDLDDSQPFEMVEIDGIDVAQSVAITEQSPLQHGNTDRGMVLQPRIIQMVLQAPNNPPTYSTEVNRKLFNRVFAPSQVLGRFRITYNNGDVYEIVARCLGNTGMGRNLEKDILNRAGVALQCPSPLWYDPVMKSVAFGIAAGSTGFTVPTPVPTFVGTSILDQTVVIEYAGTFQEFPIIHVYGPIDDMVIRNLATGRKIDLNGTLIANDDYYTFDLRFGRKFVYMNGDTTDLHTAEVTTDSQLATFAIEADPIATDGINPIQVTGTSVTSQTQVYMQYYDRYSGI